VESSLVANRLTTLVGPGGAGKTRLATEVARRWSAEGRPAWLVELAPVSADSDIAGTVLAALGLVEARLPDRPDRFTRDERDRLLDAVSETDGLLVIDNCEHLISAVAELVVEIVAVAPSARVLTTSREPLGLTGEALVSVPPLALPPAGADAEQAAEYPAVRLFRDRAGGRDREPGDTDEEQLLAPEEVREPAAQQQQTAEGQRVPGHHPLPSVGGEPQVVLGGRQRDVHDRGVQDDHQLREAQYGERQPPTPARASARTPARTRTSLSSLPARRSAEGGPSGLGGWRNGSHRRLSVASGETTPT
jgi:hypothetical protein